MLSWEYPPLVVGGIAAHVDGLARAMVRSGHEVVVLSLHTADAPDDTVVEGVRILRARIDLPWLPDDNLVARMASANHQITQLAAKLGRWQPDVVHAHDWLVAWAGDTIARLWNTPLIATIHATERGRHGGHVPPGMPAAINSVEWWLTYQAAEVICCSKFMIREVVSGFELPVEKVHLVPNGVDLAVWEPPAATGSGGTPTTRHRLGTRAVRKGLSGPRARGRFAAHAGARHSLRHRRPRVVPARVAVADRCRRSVPTSCSSPGSFPTMNCATCCTAPGVRVIPSLYEPFGIVALEAMAAGAPTVVARTGGLAEIVDGTGAGLLFDPGNHHELADRIEQIFNQPKLAAGLQATAAKLLADLYTWDAIAATTIGVYTTAFSSKVEGSTVDDHA